MYKGFYNLKDNPFRLTPDPAFLYMTSQHREALSGLVHSVCHRSALTVLTGEAGSGKTTLLSFLTKWLDNRGFVTAICSNPTLTRQEFYDLLLLKFGIDSTSFLKSRQLTALQDALFRNRADNRRTILIVDEAHRLSPDLLEELRLLLNFETPREKLLEIIIAGQPELMDVLRRPDLRQLKQRVSCFCRLHPLTVDEMREYVHHRLTQAGAEAPDLFADEAIGVIHAYSQGIPRLANNLCDGALQTGFALQARRITSWIIHEVAKDLELAGEEAGQQTPVPAAPATPVPPPVLVPVPAAALGFAAPANGTHSNGVFDPHVPLESYASRQKSIGFLANLMERWR